MQGNGNGVTYFKDCYELTSLPYFELNERGKPSLALDDVPPIVDFHTHLVFGVSRHTPQFDLSLKTTSVRHSFRERRVPIDMSLYSGVNLKNERRGGMFSEYLKTLFSNKGAMATYTVPNILDEMDRMGIEKSVLLAIDPPGSNHVSMSYINGAGDNPRLVPFCGINPRSPRWEEHMDECLENGARGIKVHPYLQWLPPDDEKVLEMIERWGKTGLPIFFHTANNGLEPSILRRLSDIERYEEPLRRFPEYTFVFGHAGMGFFERAAEMANAHGNTYLEVGGQPPQDLKRIIDMMGPDKVLYGSDWPVYPFILPIAKVMLATEGDRETRDKILSYNGEKLLSAVKAV